MIARFTAAATGILLGLGAGVLLSGLRIGPLVELVLISIAIVLVLRRVIDPLYRQRIVAIVLLAFALRVAIGVLLYAGIQAIEPGREWITGDDGEYARVGWAYAQFIRGQPEEPYVPPYWAGHTYLFGTYVYAAAASFLLFGYDPVVPSIMNAGFAAATLALIVDLCRRLFGARPALLALLIVAFFPSLVLWQSINLKESLAVLIVTFTLWSVARFGEGRRTPALSAAYVAVWLTESLRKYTFFGLAAVVPIGIALARGIQGRTRVRWVAISVAISAALFAVSPLADLAGLDVFRTFENIRVDMARQARTGFVDRPLAVNEGDTFTVPGTPVASPRVVLVAPDARIVVKSAAPAAAGVSAPPRGNEVFVQPGDLVVIAQADSTPTVTLAPQILPGEGQPVQFRPGDTYDAVGIRTVEHLPEGIAYTLLAPFPWALERTLDVLTVPEMLAWYVLVPSALWTLARRREQWRELAPIAMYVGGTLFVLALTEGNVGTLFRHRGMVIPMVVLLAAPTLAAIGSARMPALWTSRAPRNAPDRAPTV